MLNRADPTLTAVETSDRELLTAIASGDPHALDELYTRHGPALLSYLTGQLGENRQLAEELLQDVMLAVWRSAANFRGESKVRTWMISIARNQAISMRRKHRIEQVELQEIFASDGTGPLERLELANQIELLRAAIRQLPETQRETLELVFFHQMSGAEVAAMLGISEGTVKSRLHRAKETLRGLLGSEVNFA